jgi:hypothetical protein
MHAAAPGTPLAMAVPGWFGGTPAGALTFMREREYRLAPSSSGPGRRPLKAVAPVQIRSGLQEKQHVKARFPGQGSRALIVCCEDRMAADPAAH